MKVRGCLRCILWQHTLHYVKKRRAQENDDRGTILEVRARFERMGSKRFKLMGSGQSDRWRGVDSKNGQNVKYYGLLKFV